MHMSTASDSVGLVVYVCVCVCVRPIMASIRRLFPFDSYCSSYLRNAMGVAPNGDRILGGRVAPPSEVKGLSPDWSTHVWLMGQDPTKQERGKAGNHVSCNYY